MSKTAGRERLTVQAVLAILAEQPGITAYLTLRQPDSACRYLTGNETGNEPGTQNRTGDETMTTRKTPAEKARAKYLAAAKRTLSQVVTAAGEHAAALDGNGIPGGSFMTHVLKYHAALASLDALTLLGEPDGAAAAADDGMAEVSREDLQGLVKVLLGFGLPVTDGTPLARLAAAAEGPPWDTGAPASE